jgi:hypothetical protein
LVVPGLAPIPKFTKEEKLFTFKVVVVIVVAKRFVVVRAFEAYILPWTYRLAPWGLAVPIPTLLARMLAMLIVPIVAVVAKRFVTVRELLA